MLFQGASVRRTVWKSGFGIKPLLENSFQVPLCQYDAGYAQDESAEAQSKYCEAPCAPVPKEKWKMQIMQALI